MEVGNSDSLADQIKVQGDLVRRLKQEKAAKDKVRFYTFKIMLMVEKGEKTEYLDKLLKQNMQHVNLLPLKGAKTVWYYGQ